MFKQIVKTYFPILLFKMTAIAAGQSTRERADAATGQGRLTQLASDWPLSAQTGLWLAAGVLSARDTLAPLSRLLSDPHTWWHVVTWTQGNTGASPSLPPPCDNQLADIFWTPRPWWAHLETKFHQNFKLWDLPRIDWANVRGHVSYIRAKSQFSQSLALNNVVHLDQTRVRINDQGFYKS